MLKKGKSTFGEVLSLEGYTSAFDLGDMMDRAIELMDIVNDLEAKIKKLNDEITAEPAP